MNEPIKAFIKDCINCHKINIIILVDINLDFITWCDLLQESTKIELAWKGVLYNPGYIYKGCWCRLHGKCKVNV